MFQDWEFIGDISLRLFISLICGGLIGIERKRHAKKAGIRTHCLVCLGAAAFAIVSKYGFIDMRDLGLNADIARVASNIVTGVSFLGAGVIFFKNRDVSGLTTAAGIWSVSAVGLAIGCGLYSVGIIATAFIFLFQTVFYKPLRKIEGPLIKLVSVRIADWQTNLDPFIYQMKEFDKNLFVSSITKNDDGSADLVFDIHGMWYPFLDPVEFVKKYPFVTSISI